MGSTFGEDPLEGTISARQGCRSDGGDSASIDATGEDKAMKWILIFWAFPLILLGGWYGLSYYDINFGLLILSRQMHDLVFQIYGQILGLPPQDIPPLVLKAIILDSLVLAAIVAFRRRKMIVAWWRQRQEARASSSSLKIDDSLSSAP
jgi:hypothetical protein